MTTPRFVQVAADPKLIPGIYDSCDQWCMYCPATESCLAYRCGADKAGDRDMYRRLADRLFEGMIFLKELSAAEGRPTPEIDAMLSDDPRKLTQLVTVDDALERLGRRYGQLTDAYLRSCRDFPFEMIYRPSGPTPFEVFAWYHQLVPAKIYRAIMSARDSEKTEDATASAKVALIGIDRSLEALAAMAAEDEDARLEAMSAHLRRLRREVDARFPSARSFRRPGLDAPRP